MDPGQIFYRRDLPHWQPSGCVLFVTFRLAGTIPAARLRALADQRRRLLQAPSLLAEDEAERLRRVQRILFATFDQLLDRRAVGPDWLRDPAIAGMVETELRSGHLRRYHLLRWVAMPNHVHVLMRPLPIDPGDPGRCWPLAVILREIKGRTAHAANQLLGRSGEFWQRERFDHWLRDDAESARLAAYIDDNPVAAGLCARPADWRWSSAGSPAG
jgi:REP element-mobilizing transposase RayT